MKFISKITDALRLAEEHTVVIVKEAVRLPGIVLAAGVHHLDYDVRLLLKKAKDVKAAALCEIHTLAGDTETVLVELHQRASAVVAELVEKSGVVGEKIKTAMTEVETLSAKLENEIAKGAAAVEAEAIHGSAVLIQQAIHAVEAAKGRLAALQSEADVITKDLGVAEARLEIAAGRLGPVDETAALAAAEAKRAADAVKAAEAEALEAARAAELAAEKKAAEAALAAAHEAEKKDVESLIDPVVITEEKPGELPVAPVAEAPVAPAVASPVDTSVAGSVAGSADDTVDPMHQA